MKGYELEAELVADCRRAAEAMSVVLEVAGQYRADKAGQDRGFPDAVLHAGGRSLLVEFKRPKARHSRAGRCSLDQIAAAERRRSCGVETYLVDSLGDFVALVNYARTGRPRRQLRTVLGEHNDTTTTGGDAA